MIADFEIFFRGGMDLDITHLDNPDTLLGQGILSRQILLNDIENMINKCMDLYNENKLDRKSIIYQMIDGKIFEDMVEFKDNILVLTFAGFDTTASTICNLLYCLDQFGDNQFILDLKDELLTNEIDFDFMMNNEKLDSFVKETDRLIRTLK